MTRGVDDFLAKYLPDRERTRPALLRPADDRRSDRLNRLAEAVSDPTAREKLLKALGHLP